MSFIDAIGSISQKVKEFWTNTDLGRKLTILGVLALIIIAGVYLLLAGNATRAYDMLYADLDAKDAADIVAVLSEEGIPYRLENEGTAIYVPAEVKYTTRLTLASQNLPRLQSGFEMFETNNFGETQSDKRVKYQVAMQGELSRTIESIAKVRSARVHLVLPEETLFSDNQQLPSASLQITCYEGQKLSEEEINGIKTLVAHSVEGLSLDDVVIIDADGKLISDVDLTANDATLTDQARVQITMKRQFEETKQRAIQAMLDASIGPNYSVVQVNADLNFDIKQETAEAYRHDPDGTFIRSENVRTESGTDVTTAPAAIPGTDMNIPQYAETTAANGTSTYESSDRTRNYELNRTETMTQYAVGNPNYEHFTVAVLVDSHVEERLGTNEAERVSKIKGIVAAASGLRGGEASVIDDSVSVAFIEFYSEEIPAGPPVSFAVTYFPYLLAAAVLLLALIILLLFLLRKRKRKNQQQAIETQAELAAAQAQAEQAAFDHTVDDVIEQARLREPELTPEEIEFNRVREEVEKLILEDPGSAVQVIRAWLQEDQR
jgi:flagellar M-ring protein FliF